MDFNPTIHEANEHNDPIRNDDGSIRLKRNWKDLATDRQGRKFNKKIHGDEPRLDTQGFLTVKRRDSPRTPMNATNRSEQLVEKHREPGYAYYLMADEPGRNAQFEGHDYEPVMDEKGPVILEGGQARASDTKLKLMKKPQEWYDEDQRAKEALQRKNLEENVQPDTAEGQYAAVESSPLR